MIAIALIFLLINYVAYIGMFLDKSFCSKKQALIWLIPFFVLGIAVIECVRFIWQATWDAWRDLN